MTNTTPATPPGASDTTPQGTNGASRPPWPPGAVIVAACGWAVAWSALYVLAPRGFGNLLFAVATWPPVLVMMVPLVGRHTAVRWKLVGAGVVVIALADTFEGVVAERPLTTLTVVDVVFALGFGLFVAGLGLLSRRHGRRAAREGLVDGLIMMIPAFVLLAEFVLTPVAGDGSWVDRLVIVVYPTAVLVLVVMLVWLVATPTLTRSHLGLLLAGASLTLAADVVMVRQFSNPDAWWGRMLDAVYPLAYTLLAAGAARGSTTRLGRAAPSQVVHWGRVGLLAMGAIMAPLTVALAATGSHPLPIAPVAVAAVATMVVIVIRMVDLATYLQRTTRQLEKARAQLEELATRDPLTGLHNRNVLDELLDALSMGSDRPAALLSVDLDKFKAINDTHGHAAGDAVLEAVGRRLRATMRADDAVVRMGGDEFLAVLRDVTEDEVSRLATRAVRAIEEPVTWGGIELRVSASVGVALLTPDRSALSPDDAVARADAAMYAAKQAGPGRVRTAPRNDGRRFADREGAPGATVSAHDDTSDRP